MCIHKAMKWLFSKSLQSLQPQEFMLCSALLTNYKIIWKNTTELQTCKLNSLKYVMASNSWTNVDLSSKVFCSIHLSNFTDFTAAPPPALVQIMAWRRLSDKPLSEPMMREEWIKYWYLHFPLILCSNFSSEEFFSMNLPSLFTGNFPWDFPVSWSFPLLHLFLRQCLHSSLL